MPSTLHGNIAILCTKYCSVDIWPKLESNMCWNAVLMTPAWFSEPNALFCIYSFSLGLWAPVVFPSKHFVFPISCWVRLLCSLLMNICVLVLVSKLVFCFSRLTHESLRWWVAWDPVFYGVGKHLRLTQWMCILLQLKYWNPLAECFLGTLANTPDWPNHCAFSCCGWNIGFGHHHILKHDKGLYVGCRLVGNMLCPLPSPLCKVLSCVLALAASCVQHQHHVLTWGVSRSVLPRVRSASCKVLRWAACDSPPPCTRSCETS